VGLSLPQAAAIVAMAAAAAMVVRARGFQVVKINPPFLNREVV
jgi:hypothetical protein